MNTIIIITGIKVSKESLSSEVFSYMYALSIYIIQLTIEFQIRMILRRIQCLVDLYLKITVTCSDRYSKYEISHSPTIIIIIHVHERFL